MRLLTFNPETDYALAANTLSYTAPKKVEELRKSLALLPLQYAREGDVIYCPDIPEPTDSEREKKSLLKIELADKSTLARFAGRLEKVVPWGWNRALVHTLRNAGIRDSLLPGEQDMENLRRLAHRRTTISFLKLWPDFPEELIPEEVTSPERLNLLTPRMLKAPWSSAGRGLMNTLFSATHSIERWSSGIIARQGSVMSEPLWEKKLDFGTEWRYHGGRAEFLGFSQFETAPTGRFLGIMDLTQMEILHNLQSLSGWRDDLVELQRMILEKIVGSDYEGPIGIDMLADTQGRINPCVEINFRMTMGMLPLLRT